MLRRISISVALSVAVVNFVALTGVAMADAQSDAAAILQQSGISAGFFVHLDSEGSALTEALRQNEATQVHGLVRDLSRIDAARARVRTAGGYGDVAFDRFSGNQLPYVDNLVNLLVTEDLGDVPMEEVLRVLVPNGVAMIKSGDGWKKTIKPKPGNTDEWSHYLHDATGNSVAHDDVVAPPRHLQ